MFVIHTGWRDGNGTQYSGSLCENRVDAMAAAMELAESMTTDDEDNIEITDSGVTVTFWSDDSSSEEEIKIAVTEIELGGEFFGEIA